MTAERLRMVARPRVEGGQMVLGFGGWMNGGEVSLGTVKYLAGTLRAERFADIEPKGFYIYHFPGPMEVAALFRPHAVIEDGLVRRLESPTNVFHASEAHRLVLFQGQEPHLDWEDFADCVFALAEACAVEGLYFIGSYGGVVPHTRDPRLYASVSDPAMKEDFAAQGLRFSNYTGPAGFSTYLTHEAARRGVRLATLVAEIPAYVQGPNPRCIEAVARRVAALLGLQIPLDDLRTMTDAFEAKVAEAIRDRPELANTIRKMETDYDSELFNTQMSDLKEWLEERGIRLD